MPSHCPNKEICGSCSWSHIPYQKQLEQKLSDINGSFKLKELDYTCSEILPSPKTEHYRNRMDFIINFEGLFGLREKGKWWRTIDGHTCFLADKKIEAHFHAIREWLKIADLTFFDRKAHTGLLRYAVIRSTSLGETMINIVTSAPEDVTEKRKIEEALKQLDNLTHATTLIWSINNTITDISFGEELHTISGPGYIQEKINDYHFRISPNAFFQTNSSASGLLIDAVKEFAGDLSDKTLMDLYCGTGFFSIAMANEAKKTIGAELSSDAIKDAKINQELNGIGKNLEYHDVKTEEFDWMQYNPDVVILDPPRAGLHPDAMKDILEKKPKTIIYVSCKYKNFAREMLELGELYDLTKIRAVDMFPHTPHVELISKLELKVRP